MEALQARLECESIPHIRVHNQDAILGQAGKINLVKGTLKGQEHPGEEANNTFVRRVTASKGIEEYPGKPTLRSHPVKGSDVPDHLRPCMKLLQETAVRMKGKLLRNYS